MRIALGIATLAAFFATNVAAPCLAQPLVQVRADSTSVDESFIGLLAAYPNGGPELADKVADMIVAKPDQAAGLVTYVRNSTALNASQKAAAEKGFQTALARLKATNRVPGHIPWTVVAFMGALGGLAVYSAAGGTNHPYRSGPTSVSPN